MNLLSSTSVIQLTLGYLEPGVINAKCFTSAVLNSNSLLAVDCTVCTALFSHHTDKYLSMLVSIDIVLTYSNIYTQTFLFKRVLLTVSEINCNGATYPLNRCMI